MSRYLLVGCLCILLISWSNLSSSQNPSLSLSGLPRDKEITEKTDTNIPVLSPLLTPTTSAILNTTMLSVNGNSRNVTGMSLSPELVVVSVMPFSLASMKGIEVGDRVVGFEEIIFEENDRNINHFVSVIQKMADNPYKILIQHAKSVLRRTTHDEGDDPHKDIELSIYVGLAGLVSQPQKVKSKQARETKSLASEAENGLKSVVKEEREMYVKATLSVESRNRFISSSSQLSSDNNNDNNNSRIFSCNRYRLVLADPMNACGPISNIKGTTGSDKDRIYVVAMRGLCTFETKGKLDMTVVSNNYADNNSYCCICVCVCGVQLPTSSQQLEEVLVRLLE